MNIEANKKLWAKIVAKAWCDEGEVKEAEKFCADGYCYCHTTI